MKYTEEEVRLMAKVGGVPITFSHGPTPFPYTPSYSDPFGRIWEPESDWSDLGQLYLACGKWFYDNMFSLAGTAEMQKLFDLAVDGVCSGDFDKFAAAVCRLAIEIGKVMDEQ